MNNNALKYKTLTPITINELKERIENSATDYTKTIIYDVCNASSKYIHEVVLPYYNQQVYKENKRHQYLCSAFFISSKSMFFLSILRHA